MIKAPDELIDDLRAVFEKYNISIDVNDEYDGMDNYIGQSVEIRSKNFVNGSYPVFIDDIERLAEKINR